MLPDRIKLVNRMYNISSCCYWFPGINWNISRWNISSISLAFSQLWKRSNQTDTLRGLFVTLNGLVMNNLVESSQENKCLCSCFRTGLLILPLLVIYFFHLFFSQLHLFCLKNYENAWARICVEIKNFENLSEKISKTFLFNSKKLC